MKVNLRFMKYFDIERIIHSLKTALACLIGFALIRFTHLPVDQWLIITIIVVMTAQINVGSMLQKSYLRFVGTLIGSIIAILTLELLGTQFIPIATVIVISIIFFSYLATGAHSIREAGTLGAVTVVIILVSHHPTIGIALTRFLEITGGIIIAALVSQFILPIHARAHLLRSQKQTIKQLREYYQMALMLPEEEIKDKKIQALEKPIINSITTQRALADAAKRELFGEKFNSDQFTYFLQCEIEILRSIDFMHYAYQRNSIISTKLKNSELINQFHSHVLDTMEKIEKIIGRRELSQANLSISSSSLPSLFRIKQELQRLEMKLDDQERLVFDAFLFCSEILVEQLKKLVILYQIEKL